MNSLKEDITRTETKIEQERRRIKNYKGNKEKMAEELEKLNSEIDELESQLENLKNNLWKCKITLIRVEICKSTKGEIKTENCRFTKPKASIRERVCIKIFALGFSYG